MRDRSDTHSDPRLWADLQHEHALLDAGSATDDAGHRRDTGGAQ